MRKLLIDDKIRNFAVKYKNTVNNECDSVIEDLETLKDVVLESHPWKNKDGIRDYFDKFISEYPDLLALEPEKWDIGGYDNLVKEDPDFLSQIIVFKKKTKSSEGRIYEKIMECLQYSKIRKILGEIHMEMGLKTCVYCNSQAAEYGAGTLFYQLDHFMPQSKYPYLGTCFFNLQPSDSSCNIHKSNKLCDFQLYVNSKETPLSPFKLQVNILNDVPINKDNFTINLIGNTGVETKQSKEYNKMFYIDDKYLSHRQKAATFYKKALRLNESNQKALKEALGDFHTQNEFIEEWLEMSLDERFIHEEPFRKLKYDFLNDLLDNNVLKLE